MSRPNWTIVRSKDHFQLDGWNGLLNDIIARIRFWARMQPIKHQMAQRVSRREPRLSCAQVDYDFDDKLRHGALEPIDDMCGLDQRAIPDTLALWLS